MSKNYAPAWQAFVASLAFGNVLWFGDPGPNPFYAWMAFWCLMAASALLGLIGLMNEPPVKAAFDRLERRFNEAVAARRSRDT